MPIRPFINDGAFGPEVISVMAAAFEEVCKAIDVSGRSDIAKETIANKIIELARVVARSSEDEQKIGLQAAS